MTFRELMGTKREWYNVELSKRHAEDFKHYLSENDIYFEPSEAGPMVHFSCYLNEIEYETINSALKFITREE